MSTIHNVGPSQFASNDATAAASAAQSGGDGANRHQDQPQQQQQQYYQSEYPGYSPYQQKDSSQQGGQIPGYQLSSEQFYSQNQQSGASNNLLPPIPGMSQGAPSFQLTAALSASPVPNAGEFSYGSHTVVSPATPAAGNAYGGDAYTLSSSTTPMTASSNQHQFPPLPPQHAKQLPQHLRLVNTPLYHSYSYQPLGQAQGNQQQQQQQPPPPSIMLSGNPITPMSSSYQTEAFPPAMAPSSAGPGSTQPKQRAPRNKSKFKRFRNAFIYFVNDQRNKVDDETKKLKNREFLQLMSARWKKMPEDERKPYIDMAEEDKKRFENDVKKYGKYESRQRRYTKGRPHGKTAAVGHPHGAVPYTVPHPAGANHPTSADAAGDFVYHGGMNSTHGGGANMPISSLYASLSPVPSSATMAAAANWPANMRYVDLAGGGASGFQQQQQQQQQQNNSLLSPANTMIQRNSNSSIESANDIRDIQAALSPADYSQWSRANLHQQGYGGIPGTVSGLTAVAMAPGAGGGSSGGGASYLASAYQQQLSQQQQPTSPGGGLMQMPTGVPISHSLTEPMLFYGTGDASNPYLSPGTASTTNNGIGG